jgi:excisionase family DNA binding protein
MVLADSAPRPTIPKKQVADLQCAALENCMSNDHTLATTLWTVREAAEYLRCSPSYVYKAAERDLLPTVHIGRMVRFSPEAVRAFALAASDVRA